MQPSNRQNATPQSYKPLAANAESLGPVIAAGLEREVRIWHERGTILAKTLKNAAAKLVPTGRYRYRNSPFEGEHSAWQRILRDYAKFRRPPPVAELRGYRLTDDGIVQLVAQVSTASGEVAPTLKAIIAAGQFDHQMLERLNHLVGELLAWNIPLNDVMPDNVVLESSGAQPRFVLVDGYGDTRSFSLRHWSKAYNMKRQNRCFHICASFMANGCVWDEKARLFVRKDGSA